MLLLIVETQDMASEERKAADEKIQSDNLFKTLGAEEVQAETDAFQCGRCKQVSEAYLSQRYATQSLCRGRRDIGRRRRGVLMNR